MMIEESKKVPPTKEPVYPYDLTDRQIQDAIRTFRDEITGKSINRVLKVFPFIELGITELQKRQTRKVTKLSIGLGFISLLIAGAALFISYQNRRASERWENLRIEMLEQTNKTLDEIRANTAN